MKKHIIGIDLGGTSLRVALSDLRGRVLKILNVPSLAQKGRDSLINNIIIQVNRLLKSNGLNHKNVLKIGIGAPGPIRNRSIIINAPNLKGWKNVPLKKTLTRALKVPVVLENDANAAALAEAAFGAGKGLDNFIYLTVSTGIGSGIIINRKIYAGTTGAAGEVGHMIVNPNGPVGPCKQRGCLESISSGTALAKLGKKAFKRSITPIEIETLAKKGNKKALKLIDEIALYLGLSIANLSNLLDPQAFIIGGGLSNMGNLLLNPVRKYARAYAAPIYKNPIRIVPAKLRTNSGIMGAISICLS